MIRLVGTKCLGEWAVNLWPALRTTVHVIPCIDVPFIVESVLR